MSTSNHKNKNTKNRKDKKLSNGLKNNQYEIEMAPLTGQKYYNNDHLEDLTTFDEYEYKKY